VVERREQARLLHEAAQPELEDRLLQVDPLQERLDALLHDDLLFNGPTGATATKAILDGAKEALGMK
jgi:hypothetical protein